MIIFVSYDISKDEFVLFLQGIVSFWKNYHVSGTKCVTRTEETTATSAG